MPARASMMTGLHVSAHGVWNNAVHADPEKDPSHVRNIRDAGYHTAMVGKDHLIHFPSDLKSGFRRYYSEQLEKWGFVSNQPTHTHQSLGNAYPRPAPEGAELSYPQILEKEGLLEKTREYMKDYFAKCNSGQAVPWEEEPSPVPFEYHLDHYIGDQAVQWIQNYSDGRPFYLQVLFTGPHDPFDSCEEFRDGYRVEDMPVGIMTPPEEPIAANVQGVMNWSNLEGMTEEQKKRMTLYYYASITQIDEMVGRIYASLEEKGIADNTWVVYHSDHGEMLGDHMMSHKLVFFEGASRVPCIIKPPRGYDKAKGDLGWNSSALTDTLDVVATLLDISGATPLEETGGQSLLPEISRGPDDTEANKGKEYVISEVVGFAMIKTGQFKLTVNLNEGSDNKFWGVPTGTDTFMAPMEMYDLVSDPDETHNIVSSHEHRGPRQALLDMLTKHMEEKLDREKLDRFVSGAAAGAATARR